MTGTRRAPAPAALAREPAKRLHSFEREVLVRVQPRHASCRLVDSDRSLDLRTMRPRLSPGICQVLGKQGWVAAQQFGP